jgi:hypothetical protein
MTIPYGFTSPLAGTVDVSVVTVFNGAMNAVVLVVSEDVVLDGALLDAAVELDAELLLLLLEPPQPARVSAAIGSARTDDLRIRRVSCLIGIEHAPTRRLGGRAGTRATGCKRPLAHSKAPSPEDAAATPFLPPCAFPFAGHRVDPLRGDLRPMLIESHHDRHCVIAPRVELRARAAFSPTHRIPWVTVGPSCFE